MAIRYKKKKKKDEGGSFISVTLVTEKIALRCRNNERENVNRCCFPYSLGA